ARPRRFQELIGEVRAFPGARELLSTLAERGAQGLLATSSPRQELDAVVGLPDAGDAISHMTSADGVDRAKPHADVFERALELAGVGPDDAVAVGGGG